MLPKKRLVNLDLISEYKNGKRILVVQNGIAISKEKVESLMEDITGKSKELSEENLNNVAAVSMAAPYAFGRVIGKKAKCG